MEATGVANAEVQTGAGDVSCTQRLRLQTERVRKLRQLRIIDQILEDLAAGRAHSPVYAREQAIAIHRAARCRLAGELGLEAHA